MKRIFILFVFSLLVVSCKTSDTPIYTSLYKYNVSLIEPIISDSLRYKDDKIDIKFTAVTNNIEINLTNKSDKGLKINWDEISIVLFNKAGRVIHQGVKLSEKEKVQVPTTIPMNAYWTDKLVPVNNIYYFNVMGRNGDWVIYPLFKQRETSTSKKKNNDWINTMVGQTFSLYFPIHYGNETLEYNFIFKINGIEKQQRISKSKNRK